MSGFGFDDPPTDALERMQVVGAVEPNQLSSESRGRAFDGAAPEKAAVDEGGEGEPGTPTVLSEARGFAEDMMDQ